MNNFTPQQQQMLQTWAEKRDLLIRDIGTFQTELDVIKTDLKASGLALADLHIQMAEAKGRLAEIVALEERHKDSVSKEIVDLEARKATLDVQCVEREGVLREKMNLMAVAIAATTALESGHITMKDQAAIFDSAVGKIIETSATHTSDMKTVMSEIKEIHDSVITKSNENLAQTNIVLEKMPKFIFDMQKPIPVRRTYEVGHPKHGAQDLTTP